MASFVVPWDEYSGSDVETLVGALLVRIVAGAQRVDGSGGDDGVDVRAPVDGGERIYQIKGFHRRLTASQKRQISDSLATAVERQPRMVQWILALPLDLTPAEERWFTTTLASTTRVSIAWMGRTDIEQALSSNRDLLRAFAPGSIELRALDMLGTYHAEQAAMPNGAIDGIERLIGLKSLMDQTDPDWAFDVKVADKNVSVELRPKDQESARRRPLRMTLGVSATDEAANRQIAQFMHYGRPAQIPSESIVTFEADLPGNLGDLIQRTGNPAFSLMKSDEEKSWRLFQRAEAVRDARVIDTLPIEWDDRSTGPLGGSWVSGRDRSGFLEVIMTYEPDLKGGIQLRAPASDNVLPEEVIPVLRFLSLIKVGDHLRLVAPGLDPVECRVTGDPVGEAGTLEAQIAMAEELARIQSAAGVRFPVPAEWNAKDRELIYFWDQLLTHGQVQWYWPGYEVNLPVGTVRELLRKFTLPRLTMNAISNQNPVIQLLGHEYPIRGQVRTEVTNMIIPNPRTLRAGIRHLDPLTVVPVPLAQDDRTLTMFYLARDSGLDATA
jgi:hypothetical protein